ncbi:MAG: DUF4058 family protein [Fimbriimonadales bacterium]
MVQRRVGAGATACYACCGWTAKASHRVIRGGSWNNNPRNCRPANRNRNTPENRNNNLGFRVAAAQPARWIPSRTGPGVHPSRFRVARSGERRLGAPRASSQCERSGRSSSDKDHDAFALPLLPGDPSVTINLQSVFNRCYDAGPYLREIRYREDAVIPPLPADQATWAERLLQAEQN